MDKNEFVTAASWLWDEQQADNEIVALRYQIMEYNKWDESWFTTEARQEEFFDGIEGTSGLTDRLAEDNFADDSSKCQEWLRDAFVAMFQASAWDANYEMWYRYNNITGEYFWFAGTADAPATAAQEPGPFEYWMTQSDADARLQEWAAQAPAEAAEYAEAEGTWDENWNMFYKVGSGGTYLYAYSDNEADPASGQPKEPWLTYEQVSAEAAAAPAEAAAAPAEAAAVGVTEAAPEAEADAVEAPPIEAALATVVANLNVPEDLNVAALSEEEINLAFAQAVAEVNAQAA
jgi:hypothetical protein